MTLVLLVAQTPQRAHENDLDLAADAEPGKAATPDGGAAPSSFTPLERGFHVN